MNRQSLSLTPQQALERLLQADKGAEAQVQRADEQVEQILKGARDKGERLVEEAKSEAEAEAEEIIEQSRSEAEAQKESWLRGRAAQANGDQTYLNDVEAMRRQAEQHLQKTVDRLVGWVIGKEL